MFNRNKNTTVEVEKASVTIDDCLCCHEEHTYPQVEIRPEPYLRIFTCPRTGNRMQGNVQAG